MSNQAIPEIHVVRVETRHFNFEAVGLTYDQAVDALEQGWAKHRAQAGERAVSMPEATFAALDKEFGVSHHTLKPGQCYRDGTALL